MTPQRIAGRVTRQNVCQPLAPRVAAACSCSSPISCSTGITSRTTNGSETNITASTIPTGVKMTSIPTAARSAPNQPWVVL